MKLEGFFDFACPFCYLGHHAMKQASKRYSLSIHYIPWELSPPLSPRPDPGTEAAREERYRTRLKPLADRLGIEMCFPRISPRPCSRLALQGFYLAEEAGCSDAYREWVFRACYVDGQDISRPEILTGILQQAGMDPGQLEMVMETGRYLDRLAADREEGVRRGASRFPRILPENRR
ncbi:MAG: DsbA family protein [Clostridiales bacterium]|nr:DsbA family protein [Clostridiales bacterium]